MTGRSILLIEDSAADVGLVREALCEYDIRCDLIVITDGDQAIRYVQSMDSQSADPPGLIIMDLNLPKRTGREVLQCLRASVCCRNAPTLILSSSDAWRDRNDVMQLGADRYIRKPLHLEEFLNLGAVFKEMLHC